MRFFVNKRIMIGVLSVLLVALVFPLPAFPQTREELEAQLKQIEAEIAQYERELRTTKTQKQTLSAKIAQLKREQEQVALRIQATNLEIHALNRQLDATEASIEQTLRKLNQSQEEMAEILLAVHEQNDSSLVEVLLGSGFQAFVREFETLEQLSQDLAATVSEVKATKAVLDMQYAELSAKQEEREGFLKVQVLQRQTLLTKTNEQGVLLKETQGKEARYQAMLSDSQQRAAEIRSRIYELLGVTRQINFGQAVEIAQWVSGQTGIRPALLLAVLTQESNLGKNVGTCNRPGDPTEKGWRVVMKPERDHQPFLAITASLGLDPDTTPVSCPMRDAKGRQVGWGGAMGPAQFIPSTWMGYKDRVAALNGKGAANPWDIRDGFIAAALYLKNAGAKSGDEQSEWAAAMRYFSGSTNPRFRFYGDNVLALARRYEADIAALQAQ